MKVPFQTKKKTTAGGSILRAIARFFVFFCKTVAVFLVKSGLLIPILYALFGLILFWTIGFDPIALDVWGTLYLSGMIACVLACAVIFLRSFVVRPMQSVFHRKKRNEKYRVTEEKDDVLLPFDQSKKETTSTVEYLVPIEHFAEQNDEATRWTKYTLYQDWTTKNDGPESQTEPFTIEPEQPKIYRSALDPAVIVHEYSDRFELFKEQDNKSVQIGVEFK